MREIATLQLNLLEDRGFLKLRTNIVKGGRVFGSLKTL